MRQPARSSSFVVAALASCAACAGLYVAWLVSSAVLTRPHSTALVGMTPAIEVIAKSAAPSGHIVPEIVVIVLAQTSLIAWVVARNAKRRREP